MSYEYYKIQNNSMDQLYQSVSAKFATWNEELTGLANIYKKIIETEECNGKTAEAIKAYFSEVHGTLLYAIQQALSAYQINLLLYKTGYYEIDTDTKAILPQEIIKDVKNRLSTEYENLTTISSTIGASLNSISDIINIPNPTINRLSTELYGMKTELGDFDARIETYEETNKTLYKEKIQPIFDALQETIQNYLTNEVKINEYEPGNITGNMQAINLYQKLIICSQDMTKKQTAIENAIEKQQSVYDEMQKEEEEKYAKARKEKGIVNILKGIISFAVGTGAILLSGGTAIPIVILGMGSVAFGTSDLMEGGQDLYYGSIGNIESITVNPLRDSVFLGNQEVYDICNELTVTTAELCMPIGIAYKGSMCISTPLVSQSTTKMLIKEVSKDILIDKGSQYITEYTADKYNLTPSQVLMLNLGMGMLLETGTDIAGNKIAVNKLHGINNEHVVISDTDIDPNINVGKYGTDIENSFANEVMGESASSTSRPTWRQSELDAATDFPDYDAQKSFINGEAVPYGTKGSVRPDYYKDGFSVDIKNYNVESASGRSNLARNIEKQYYQRIENMPDGTKQSVMIDVRGQNVSDEALDALYDDIMRRTNNGVEILFKMD